MRNLKTVFGLTSLAVALAGCYRTVNTVEVGKSVEGEYRWIITDSGLSQVASVVSARKTRADDLLRVEVEVENLRPIQQRFYYRFEWFDADGNIVDTPLSTWQPQIVAGRERVVLRGIAPNPRVTDCRLKLQESSR